MVTPSDTYDIENRAPTFPKGPVCSYCIESGIDRIDWQMMNCTHFYSKSKHWQSGYENNRKFEERFNSKGFLDKYLERFRKDFFAPILDESYEESPNEIAIIATPRHVKYEDGSTAPRDSWLEDLSGDIIVVPMLPAWLPKPFIGESTKQLMYMLDRLIDIKEKYGDRRLTVYHYAGSAIAPIIVLTHAFYILKQQGILDNWVILDLIHDEDKIHSDGKKSKGYHKLPRDWFAEEHPTSNVSARMKNRHKLRKLNNLRQIGYRKRL